MSEPQTKTVLWVGLAPDDLDALSERWDSSELETAWEVGRPIKTKHIQLEFIGVPDSSNSERAGIGHQVLSLRSYAGCVALDEVIPTLESIKRKVAEELVELGIYDARDKIKIFVTSWVYKVRESRTTTPIIQNVLDG